MEALPSGRASSIPIHYKCITKSSKRKGESNYAENHRRYRDREGNKLTDFISIKVRGPLAERCAAFAYKGCKLAASGDFETICFAEDPTRQPGFLIKANEVEFLSPKKVEEAAGVAGDAAADAA